MELHSEELKTVDMEKKQELTQLKTTQELKLFGTTHPMNQPLILLQLDSAT